MRKGNNLIEKLEKDYNVNGVTIVRYNESAHAPRFMVGSSTRRPTPHTMTGYELVEAIEQGRRQMRALDEAIANMTALLEGSDEPADSNEEAA